MILQEQGLSYKISTFNRFGSVFEDHILQEKLMKLFLSILIAFSSIVGFSQIEAEKQRHSFGDLYKDSQSYVDINFKNTSDKVQYLLSVEKPRDVYYIYSSKKVLPDSSLTIRFKVNNNRKGRFTYNVDVYFSNPRSAITVQLNGNVKEAEVSSSLTACPDFNDTPPSYISTAFDVTIKVIDSITREPIKNSAVYLVMNNEMIGKAMTNSKGIVQARIPLGYYYITAQKKPYYPNHHEGYLNFKRNYVEIELQQPEVDPPLNQPPVIIEDEPEIVEEKPENPPEIIEEDEDEIVIDPNQNTDPPIVEEKPEVEIIETEPVNPVALQELPDTVFNESYFAYNNITFILDVSTSMNGMGKMDLLKSSMISLAEILRADDRISIIKYASEVETLMQGESGANTAQIVSTVSALKSSGFTAGGNAIKAAYKMNRKNFIEGGNNIVIMITDGVFNRGDKDYLKTIRNTYAKNGTVFSVVGIKTSEYITGHMKNVVAEGGGDFIRIITAEDAEHKLIDEIKRTSFKFKDVQETD